MVIGGILVYVVNCDYTTSICWSTHPSAPQGNWCEISHFLASVEACNLILLIHLVINGQLPKQCVSIDQSHMTMSWDQLSFYWVILWLVTSFQLVVGSTQSKWNSITSLLFEVNYCINLLTGALHLAWVNL